MAPASITAHRSHSAEVSARSWVTNTVASRRPRRSSPSSRDEPFAALDQPTRRRLDALQQIRLPWTEGDSSTSARRNRAPSFLWPYRIEQDCLRSEQTAGGTYWGTEGATVTEISGEGSEGRTRMLDRA